MQQQIPTVEIDLDSPPDQRWAGLVPYVENARLLLRAYLEDLGKGGASFDEDAGLLLEIYIERHLEAEERADLRAIADIIDLPFEQLALVNLYYDLQKTLWGCTAFGVAIDGAPVLARNLDWWSPGNALSDHSLVLRYLRGGKERFSVVGWPGFIGALSGSAPQRFAVTLNAVVSDEGAADGPPVTLVLRRLLDHAAEYDDAVRQLQEQPLFSDSILTLVGIEPDQMCVIERSPTRSATRRPQQGIVVATNDYRALETNSAGTAADSALADTSCTRFDRATQRASGTQAPQSAQDCLAILNDPQVRMDITVQQMVFCPARSSLSVRTPPVR